MKKSFGEIIKSLPKEGGEWFWFGDLADHFEVNNYPDGNKWEGSLSFHWIKSWICTDTRVGYGVLMIDGEVVAITSQLGRKEPVEFEWISLESWTRARDFVVEHTISYPPSKFVDMSETIDVGK